MAARNPITGDLIKTKVNSEEYKRNLEKLFGDKPPTRGKWKQDPDTGRMVPIEEWYSKPKEEGPLTFINHFEAYESPTSGKIINNKREHLNDLHASGCRVYEGRQQEAKEAAKWRAEQDRKLDRKLTETLNRTMYEIEHGYRQVSD